MTTSRAQAIQAINSYNDYAPFDFEKRQTGEYYGENVFGAKAMQKYLPKAVYKSLKKTIEQGATLDSTLADAVATGMKEWALSKGATHYAHIFFPLTGWTAEKHDTFWTPDGEGGAIAEFPGKLLIQGEPDASSFPNGGLRGTHHARGYTVWDVTSPAYLTENPNGRTLCIPTAFLSWTGEALDNKTPVLRSSKALDVQVRRMLKVLGHTEIAPVVSYAGPEQEYFLVDKNWFYQRLDLQMTGRTLVGNKPAKGQQFDDHYFGVIPERVLSFMIEVDTELFKLGIPSKTRHNEVAPGQFEIAPLHELGNLACDHQQQVMTTLRSVADRYGLVALTHEKPFAGLNGSGKHLNYSFGNATQGNLLDPGDTPHDNLQFLVFCGAIIRGVDKYAGLLRGMIASASNDHRLGANEAPPAIISIFLGDQLQDVFDQIKAGGARSSKEKGTLVLGVDTLPILPKDPGDRNRTSPFAFTGNRFEFRAVGGHQAINGPQASLNTMFAESIDWCATELEKSLASGMKLGEAAQKLLKGIIDTHGRVVFNGNGYSAEWRAEAEKRGLPILRTAVDALPVLNSKEVIELFDKYGVMTPAELHSRYEIMVELYVKNVELEASTLIKMAKTQILPAVLGYQTTLAQNVAATKAAGVEGDVDGLGKISTLIGSLKAGIVKLEGALGGISGEDMEGAKLAKDTVIPAMGEVRAAVDALENLVDYAVWPLPTYQEMLAIK